jgi:hypothetical protein
MNKAYSLLIGLVISFTGFSKSCLPYGITFETQAQVDNFQIEYPNCTEIEGNVWINGDDITNLNGLNVLTYIGGELYLNDSDSLTDLTGLENLNYIGGLLMAYSNDMLTSFSGLDNLTAIGQQLFITHNDALTSFSGLGNVTSIGGFLEIIYNNSLASLNGLENLNFIADYIWIAYNPAMNSLSGLGNLDSIGGYLGNGYSPSLTSLNGLSALTSIGGNLVISSNDSLTNLTELGHLTSIGGNLFISYNKALSSLKGLDNIDANSISNLEIHHNDLLCECEVQSICNCLADPNGYVYIDENYAGCNTEDEVEAACAVGLDETTYLKNNVNLYPNPSSTQITIATSGLSSKFPARTTNAVQSGGQISIFNLSGQQFTTQQITEPLTTIDISGLAQGVYFVQLTDDMTAVVGKFMKH